MMTALPAARPYYTTSVRSPAQPYAAMPRGDPMHRSAIRLLLLHALLVLTSVAPAAIAHEAGPWVGTGIASQRILTVRFADAPAAPAFIAVVRFILPPGATIASDPTVGPRLFLVESGEVTLRSGNPGESGFLRAADAPTSAVGPGASELGVSLLPGAFHAVTEPVPIELRNETGHATVILHAMISPTPPSFVRPATGANGAITDPLVSGVASALPAAPITVQIDRVGIDTGRQVTLPPAPGPRLLVVQSGTLGLAAIAGDISYSSAASNNPGSVAGRVRTAAPGSEILLTARGSAFLQPDASGIARNLGRNRLTLLALSILSTQGAASSGYGTVIATPPA